MPLPSQTNQQHPMAPNPRWAISSLPSRHYKHQFWCVDGPFDGQRLDYRGKRVRLRVGVQPNGIVISGEYKHTWRHLGNRQGYEHYYQWYGPEV